MACDIYLHPQPSMFHKLPFQVSCIGTNVKQGIINRPNGFPDHQWLFCSGGQGELCCNNQTWLIQSGMGIFLPANIPHKYKPLTEIWITDFIAFNGSGVSTLLKDLNLTQCYVESFQSIHLIRQKLQRIFHYATIQYPGSGTAMSSLLYQLLIELADDSYYKKTSYKPDFLKRLKPLLDVLPSRCHEYMTIDEMADIINVSPQYLCRLFKKTHKIRPMQYLTQCRIRKAQELLSSEQELPIALVSEQCGFESFSYFCTVFKKNTNLTPSGYREMFR